MIDYPISFGEPNVLGGKDSHNQHVLILCMIFTGRSLHCRVEQPHANTLHGKNPTFYIKHHQNGSNFYEFFVGVDIHGTYYIVKNW